MAPRAASLIGQPPALRDLRGSEYDDGPGPGALFRGSPGPWWRSPTLPLCGAALVAPGLAVVAPWVLAPLLALAVLLALPGQWREQRAWPWPRAAALAPLALAGWGAASALWAPDPLRALTGAGYLAAAALLGGACAVMVEDERLGARRGLAACAAIGFAGGLALMLSGPVAAPAAPYLAILPPLALRLRVPAPWRWLLLAAATGGALLLPGETARLAALAGGGAALLAGLGGRVVSSLLALVLAGAMLASPVLLPRAMPDIAAGASRPVLQRLLGWDFALERAGRAPLAGWGMEASRSLPGAHATPSPAAMARIGIPGEVQEQLLAGGVERMPDRPGNAALQVFLELGWIGLGLAALAVLALGWGAAPAGTGVLAAAAVASLGIGAWEPWWLGSLAFTGALAAALSVRRG
ncbi:hypothetical protein [Roseomonas populi]|uniref:O-antigen ligase domain-containing protein n=1 Tax=Roseomonas populi TaxID=3121582 RepID=A0ABT1WYF7_9PROT|nr:hypothetical protein [Roseomonas pecuniae]MCR0980849.1 hypothetical protein [Roseomonas pecuniae]